MEHSNKFDELISGLGQFFADDKVNVEDVLHWLGSYESHPADWRKFAYFDPHRYTRNLVDEGNGKYNIMLLCWGEGMGSSIHDHSNAHCFVKVLEGTLKETLFEWPKEEETPMVETQSNFAKTNQCMYIDDTIGLHRVENPSHSDAAVSLHIYIPPFGTCQTFDQRTGRKLTSKVTFWSRYGERTKYQVPCSAVFEEADPSPSRSVVATSH